MRRWPIPVPGTRSRGSSRCCVDPRRGRRRLRLVQVLPRGAAGDLRGRGAVAPRRALRQPGGGAVQVRLARGGVGPRRSPIRSSTCCRGCSATCCRRRAATAPSASRGRRAASCRSASRRRPSASRASPRPARSATPRATARARTPTPVIVPTGPSHTTNAMAFLDFLEAAANDPRWSGDGMLPEIDAHTSTSGSTTS